MTGVSAQVTNDSDWSNSTLELGSIQATQDLGLEIKLQVGDLTNNATYVLERLKCLL